MDSNKIILVEPNFPIPQKSKNHKNFLPIGLLKIASYLQKKNIEVKLIRGIPKNPLELSEIKKFSPSEIWVTSLFTYWAKYVKDAVQYYKNMFPQSKIVVGGVYASLFSKKEVKEYTGCDEVYQGVMPEVEKYFPAYDLIKNSNPHPIDYQIIHASRGCTRKCDFCGTWKIEPKFIPKKSIKNEIKLKKIVFYDNNLLMNPYIEEILQELIDLKKEKKIQWCESQSGFDGRILLKKPCLAEKIKKAGFRYPRIAWDWQYKDCNNIEIQINILKEASYPSKEIYIFMIYNWNIPFKEMEMKRIKCWEWNVQIADCRYRPLDQLYDNYNGRKTGQTLEDYYIHEKAGWTDILVKQFRKNIRQQNICIRHGFPFYSKDFEQKRTKKELTRITKNINTKKEKIKYLEKNNISYWFPEKISK
jgi:hypothetical protein